jgi:type IV secretory pathway ATPase VirB11/archaellum biosynthesis ATPase
LSIISKLQNTFINLKQGHFTEQNKEEEICSYRTKQTKNRKTIFINCKDCNSRSSLNDTRCRKNILSILQKEVHADCLVLSRLYERDYEGEALALLYVLAGFSEIVTAYRSTERVQEAFNLPEKKECDLERAELITFFAETVKSDPLKARLEIRRFIQGKMLRHAPDTHPACSVCSECFYYILHEIEEKLSHFPEIPTLKRADVQCFSLKMIEYPQKMTDKDAAKIANEANLIDDTSSEITQTSIPKSKLYGQILHEYISPENIPPAYTLSEHIPSAHTLPEHTPPAHTLPEHTPPAHTPPAHTPPAHTPPAHTLPAHASPGNISSESILFSRPGNIQEDGGESKQFAEELFDYESAIKPYVRPPFSSSRIYTEAPENTEFLECYDINGREGRKLEVTVYRCTDRPEKLYMIRPPEYNLRQDELRLLEKVRRRMIRYRPKNLAFTEPADAREYFRRMAKELLEEELLTDRETCGPEEIESYADLLARYTNGFGIVEDLLSDAKITDVYINAPADTNPVHVVMDGEECASNVYLSQDDLDALVSRFRAISGRPFGEAVPVLELNLEAFGVRVSVIGDPLSANGLAYAFRKHSLSPWTLPKLINAGSITPLAAGLLGFLMDGQASVLVAGEVGAGKTSLLSAMLLEIPQKYRILTIEDTHELPIEKLQGLGWKVQAMSSHSSVLKSGAEMSPETALRAALRLGSSSLVLGEVRGPEVKVLMKPCRSEKPEIQSLIPFTALLLKMYTKGLCIPLASLRVHSKQLTL